VVDINGEKAEEVGALSSCVLASSTGISIVLSDFYWYQWRACELQVRGELAAKGICSIAISSDITKADACKRCTGRQTQPQHSARTLCLQMSTHDGTI
jgi:hypothetical protein